MQRDGKDNVDIDDTHNGRTLESTLEVHVRSDIDVTGQVMIIIRKIIRKCSL